MTSNEIFNRYIEFKLNPILENINVKLDDNIYKNRSLVFSSNYTFYIFELNCNSFNEIKEHFSLAINWFKKYYKQNGEVLFYFKGYKFSVNDIKFTIEKNSLIVEIIL